MKKRMLSKTIYFAAKGGLWSTETGWVGKQTWWQKILSKFKNLVSKIYE